MCISKASRSRSREECSHYDDVIMTMLASQITSLPVVCSIVYSDVNQRKHQSSASLAFVREIHRGPVNFPHKWPVTRKMFPFDDVIMMLDTQYIYVCNCLILLSCNSFWPIYALSDIGISCIDKHSRSVGKLVLNRWSWCYISIFNHLWFLVFLRLHDNVIKWKHFPCY